MPISRKRFYDSRVGAVPAVAAGLPLLRLQQPHLDELLQVVGDPRLGQADRVVEVARADRLVGGRETFTIRTRAGACRRDSSKCVSKRPRLEPAN